MKSIEGDLRRYLIINTTEYNEDQQYAVSIIGLDEFDRLGLGDVDDIDRADRMKVGQIIDADIKGCYIFRIA